MISENGVIKKSWVGKTIINSKFRLTYKEAEDIILGNSHKLNEEIKILNSIAQIFRKQRIKKGSVIIKQEETKIKFNKDNEPEKAIRKKTLLANQLVEEFMLLANRKVANKLKKCIYRIHDIPNKDQLEEVARYVKQCGVKKINLDVTNKSLAITINKLLSNRAINIDVFQNLIYTSFIIQVQNFETGPFKNDAKIIFRLGTVKLR